MIDHLPAVATAVLTAVLVGAEHQKHLPTKIVSKTGAAWGFLMYAGTLGVWSVGPHGKWFVLGLVLSMVGDLCLLSREKKWFLAGLGAFLLGHVAYVGAFLALGVNPIATAFAGLAIGGFAWRVWVWLKDDVGSMGPAVMAYIAVISTMVACAAGSAAVGGPGRWGLLLAAVLFFLSDLCVARDRFVSPGWDNRAIGLPLYFGAQLLYAWFASLTGPG